MAEVTLGHLPEFNPQINSWPTTKKKIANFLILNGITEEPIKRALLINILNEDAYILLSNLCVPDEPETRTYVQLISLLDKHFAPARVHFAEREKFYESRKEINESVADWAARVRSLSVYCKFGASLNTVLRDKFIMGLETGPARDKIYMEDVVTLTMEKAVELAQNVEAVQLRRTPSTQVPVKSEPADIFKLGAQRQGNQASRYRQVDNANKRKFKCSVCGYKNHSESECRYKNCTCDGCGEKGHIKSNCKNKGKRVPHGKVRHHMMNAKLYSLDICASIVKPFTEQITVNNVVLNFEIDSGAAVTVISNDLYERYFSKIKLNKSELTLMNYTGLEIQPLGKCKLNFTYRNKTDNMDVYVVDNGGPPLLGRDWMKKFSIGISAVNHITNCKTNPIVSSLFNKYSAVFSDKLGTFTREKVILHLKEGNIPKFVKPRPLPYAMVAKVNDELDRLLDLEIISPVEYSPWGTPIVPVLKSDGSVRLCGDYKITLNPWLQEDKYPLPRINDLFSTLCGGVEFTKLDLSQAYQQILLNDKSRILTTISTHRGLFAYNRIPFGISPAPSRFQKIMDKVLSGIPGCVAFIDDILITGSNRTEHLERLHEVLKRLQASGLTLQKEKCKFFEKSVTYLGHLIDKNGLHKKPDIVNAIKEAPKPCNIDQLRSFLGLINYYRNFIPHAAEILHPLTELLKKDVNWEWSQECDYAFNTVRDILSSDNVLCHFDPSIPVKLTVDASPYGIGAIISHVFPNNVERPIACVSRTLTRSEENYSQLHKEALAIVYGVRYFYQYLYGRRFILQTDSKPLTAIFGPKNGIPQMAASRLQRYAIFLSGFTYDIEYVESRKNTADFLSRAPLKDKEEATDIEEHANLNYILESKNYLLNFDTIGLETSKDLELQIISKYLKMGWPSRVNDIKLKPYFNRAKELTLENNCVMWGFKLIIPKSLQSSVLEELHASHQGVVKMKSIARSYFWWPGIDQQIENTCKSCEACICKTNSPPKCELLPWPWPNSPWERIHCDFFGPVLNHMYFVIIDAHSKWPEIFKVKSITTVATINILRSVFSRFGIPKHLVSDNGPQFTCNEFKSFCKKNGITHLTGAPYHAATNGAAENIVKTTKRALIAAYKNNRNVDIDYALNLALFDYRTTVHSTTGMAPAYLMFNRNIRTRFDLINPHIQHRKTKNVSRKFVKKQQSNQKKYYAGKRNVTLHVGQNIYVKDYRVVNKVQWIHAKIARIINRRLFSVYVPELNTYWRRHLNQIKCNVYQEDISVVNSNVKLNVDTLPTSNSTKDVNDNENGSEINLHSKRIRKPPERFQAGDQRKF